MEAGPKDSRPPKRRRDDSDDESDMDSRGRSAAARSAGSSVDADLRPGSRRLRGQPSKASRVEVPNAEKQISPLASVTASSGPAQGKASRGRGKKSQAPTALAAAAAAPGRSRGAHSAAAAEGAAASKQADSDSDEDDDLDAQLMSPTDVALPPLKSRGRRPIVRATELDDFAVDTTWVADSGGADEAYEVSCVVAERGVGKDQQVRVRWVGWPPSDDTWEPAASFPAKDKIAEFRADCTLLGLAAQVDGFRRYLEKGSCFENDRPVKKQDRGKARAVLLYLLRRLADVVCGKSAASKHARNVLGSCVYPSVSRAAVLKGGTGGGAAVVQTLLAVGRCADLGCPCCRATFGRFRCASRLSI